MSRTQIIKADVEHPGIYASVNLNGFTLASEERPANHLAVLLGYRVPHIPEVWFGVGYRDGDRYWLGPRGLDPHYAQLNVDQVVIWKAVEWPFQFDEDRGTSSYLQYRYILGEGPWETEEEAKAEWEQRRNAGVLGAAPTQAPQQPKETALERFKACQGDEEIDPIERLRFFCSCAMSGQDWLDVEPFFDALSQQPTPSPTAQEPNQGFVHLAAPSGDVPTAVTVDAQSANAPSAAGSAWKPLPQPGNAIENPDPYCGHMKRGVRKSHCERCMRAAYPGVPFEEAARRFADESGVSVDAGKTDRGQTLMDSGQARQEERDD